MGVELCPLDVYDGADCQRLQRLVHEIRNPLLVIFCGLDELRRSSSEMSGGVSDSLAALAAAADQIDALLRFGPIAGPSAFKKEIDTISTHAFASEITIMLMSHARSKGLTLDLRIHPSAPDKITQDLHLVRQILMNLLINAIKFTDQGLVTLEVAGPENDTDAVVFRVKDNGGGVRADVVPRLFHPLESRDAEDVLPRVGMGIGLAISSVIASRLSGSLELASNAPGEGAVFELTLPRRYALAN